MNSKNSLDTIAETVSKLLSKLGLQPPSTSKSSSPPLARAGRVDVRPGQPNGASKPCGQHDITPEEWSYCLRRAAQAWLSIYESLVCDVDLPHKPEEGDARKLVQFLARLDHEGLMLNWVKESSCYIAAKAYSQDLTNEESYRALLERIRAIPDIGDIPAFGTLGYGWVRSRCKWMTATRHRPSHALRERIVRAAHNVQFVKRGMPCMREQYVRRCMEGHRDLLTNPAKGPVEFEEKDNFELVKLCLGRLTSEVFKGRVFDPEEVTPSFNASYGFPRSLGGAATELVGNFLQSDGNNLSAVHISLASHELQSAIELKPGEVVWIYAHVGKQRLLESFSDWCSAEAVASASGGKVRAAPAPILEPCKCRIITKEEAPIVQRGFSLQKFMHRTLSKVDVFQFIGKPIDMDTWSEWMPTRLPPGWAYVSGDFTGATDRVNGELSTCAFQGICDNARLPDGTLLAESSWAEVGHALLTGHELDYNAVLGERRKGKRKASPDLILAQRNGQLMGSPASFPVLNLINGASTAVSLGWGTTRGGSVLRLLREHHVLTNGDDIVFAIPRTLYPKWVSVNRTCGLVVSLGKNFLSTEFAEMNSEMRYLTVASGPLQKDEVGPLRVWTELGFLNLPILFGLEAKGIEAGESVLRRLAWFQVAPLANALIWGVDEVTAAHRITKFMQYYEPVLRRVPPGVGYHIPQHLGGVGIPDPLGKASYETGNLKRAAWLACLTPQQRVEALSPPPARATGVMDGLCKEVLKMRTTRRTIRQTDLGCESLVRLTTQTRMSAGVLTEILHKFFWARECCLADDDPQANLWLWTVAGEKPERGTRQIYENGRVLVVSTEELEKDHLRREGRYARAIFRQCRRANSAYALQPMSAASLSGWSVGLQFEEVDIGASYRVRLACPEPFLRADESTLRALSTPSESSGG